MPYLVRKRMTLDGKAYGPGDLAPQSLVDSIRPGRFDSLVRLRYLQEVTPNQAVTAHRKESTTPSEEGETCPICDGGPYRNLKAHMTKMHKAQEE
jgi:hypothetical protein